MKMFKNNCNNLVMSFSIGIKLIVSLFFVKHFDKIHIYTL